jgi:hypothetical protein
MEEKGNFVYIDIEKWIILKVILKKLIVVIGDFMWLRIVTNGGIL